MQYDHVNIVHASYVGQGNIIEGVARARLTLTHKQKEESTSTQGVNYRPKDWLFYMFCSHIYTNVRIFVYICSTVFSSQCHGLICDTI